MSVLICFRALAQMEISGTTDASLIVADCADGTPGLTTTSAATTASVTSDCFSG